MVLHPLQRLVGAMLLLASSPLLNADQSATTTVGDLWEVTSQMSMEGMDMQMPAQTSQVCAPKTWTQPPGGGNQQQECRNDQVHLRSRQHDAGAQRPPHRRV